MREDAETYFVQRRGILVLWGGLLLGPVAWISHQQVSYLLVYWACGSGGMFVFHVLTILLLLLAGLGVYLAWTAWRHSGPEWADEGGTVSDRSRFLALTGLLLNGLFSLVILAQWLPTLLVDPCVR